MPPLMRVPAPVVLVVLLAAATACGPRTAREIIDRSLAVHGGPMLSQWKTLTHQGHGRPVGRKHVHG